MKEESVENSIIDWTVFCSGTGSSGEYSTITSAGIRDESCVDEITKFCRSFHPESESIPANCHEVYLFWRPTTREQTRVLTIVRPEPQKRGSRIELQYFNFIIDDLHFEKLHYDPFILIEWAPHSKIDLRKRDSLSIQLEKTFEKINSMRVRMSCPSIYSEAFDLGGVIEFDDYDADSPNYLRAWLSRKEPEFRRDLTFSTWWPKGNVPPENRFSITIRLRDIPESEKKILDDSRRYLLDICTNAEWIERPHSNDVSQALRNILLSSSLNVCVNLNAYCIELDLKKDGGKDYLRQALIESIRITEILKASNESIRGKGIYYQETLNGFIKSYDNLTGRILNYMYQIMQCEYLPESSLKKKGRIAKHPSGGAPPTNKQLSSTIGSDTRDVQVDIHPDQLYGKADPSSGAREVSPTINELAKAIKSRWEFLIEKLRGISWRMVIFKITLGLVVCLSAIWAYRYLDRIDLMQRLQGSPVAFKAIGKERDILRGDLLIGANQIGRKSAYIEIPKGSSIIHLMERRRLYLILDDTKLNYNSGDDSYRANGFRLGLGDGNNNTPNDYKGLIFLSIPMKRLWGIEHY